VKMEQDIEVLEAKVRGLEEEKLLNGDLSSFGRSEIRELEVLPVELEGGGSSSVGINHDHAEQLAAENAFLHAQLAAMQDGANEKSSRMTELESSLAELRAQLRSQQMRFEKMKREWSGANDEVERLTRLLEEADGAAMQLELENGAAKTNERKVVEQEQTILALNADCRELQMQVMNLTKQLELAVADLETEAKQTERFTACFLDLSHKLEDHTDGDVQILNLESLLGPGEGIR
jgi:chromosome segregation ATPase